MTTCTKVKLTRDSSHPRLGFSKHIFVVFLIEKYSLKLFIRVAVTGLIKPLKIAPRYLDPWFLVRKPIIFIFGGSTSPAFFCFLLFGIGCNYIITTLCDFSRFTGPGCRIVSGSCIGSNFLGNHVPGLVKKRLDGIINI